MVKVLFVCLRNICRSPMAEAVFRDMVEKENLSEKIKIDSAATSSWEHGNPVHYGTREKLAEVGISVEGMYSRPLNDNDLMADYIVGMDDSNIDNIKPPYDVQLVQTIKVYAPKDYGNTCLLKVMCNYSGNKYELDKVTNIIEEEEVAK